MRPQVHEAGDIEGCKHYHFVVELTMRIKTAGLKVDKNRQGELGDFTPLDGNEM